MGATMNAEKTGSRPWGAPTRRIRVLLPLAYTAAIFALSSIPDTPTPETELERVLTWMSPTLQNLLHIPLFGGLAWCWYWGLSGWLRGNSARLWAALALTIAWSLLDEYHQLSVPGRFGSWTDVALNAVGAGLVAVAITLPRKR